MLRSLKLLGLPPAEKSFSTPAPFGRGMVQGAALAGFRGLRAAQQLPDQPGSVLLTLTLQLCWAVFVLQIRTCWQPGKLACPKDQQGFGKLN